jgi:putative alpha-1,2-mannosidase
MAAMGLFQTDGGCNATPIYELTTPLYERIVIHLDGRYGRGKTFTINAPGVSKNRYIRSATLNGKPLNNFYFPASELLRGGTLNITTSESIQGDK